MYECRASTNFAFGTLSTAAATGDLVLNSAEFATALPSGLSTTIYTPMTLQDITTKVYEIVWVTAHGAAATACTVVRAKEGTTARAWPSGTPWLVGPTTRDSLYPVVNRAALPSDPHVGMRALIQDEQVAATYTPLGGWINDRSTEVHAAYRCNTTQTFPTATVRKVFYGTAVATTPLVSATYGTTATGSYFTLNRAGVWLVEGGVNIGWAGGTAYRAIAIADEPFTTTYRTTSTLNNGAGSNLAVSMVRRFTAGSRVAVSFYHEQGTNVDVVAADCTAMSLTWLGP